jgi:hypothetical protein
MREKAFLERKPFPAFILISQKVVRLCGYSLKTPVFMWLLAPVGSADSQTSLSVLPFFFILFPMA